MVQNDDRYYIRRVLSGETQAYAYLVNRHKGMVFSLAMKLLKNREDAEEVAQDTFVKAYQSMGSFRGGAKFSTWLYRIVYNTAISRLRRIAPETIDLDQAAYNITSEDVSGDAYQALKEEDRKKYLDMVLSKLEPEEDFLITLYYYEEKSLDEIAEISEISKNHVKVKIYRTRQKMLQLLRETLNEEIIGIL
jgi:RNA polymerase sigma factor (sigma-70 family)